LRRKPKATGYGSYRIELSVVVQKPYDQMLLADGWKVLSSSDQATTFLFESKNCHIGDDETAVHALFHSLPHNMSPEAYQINWDASAY